MRPLFKEGHVHTSYSNTKGDSDNGKCELPTTFATNRNPRKNSLTDALIILEGTIEGYHVQRIYVDGGSSSKIMYEHCFKSFGADVKSRLRKYNASLIRFSGETYHPLGLIDLSVTMGEPKRRKTVLLEFAIVKCRSPYNVIIGRTGMRSLRAAYPFTEAVIHKKRPLTPDRRKVFEWLREGIIRRVQHPRRVAKAVPIKQRNNTWLIQMECTSVNKFYAKDMYLFPRNRGGALVSHKIPIQVLLMAPQGT
nr:reverse transcriptase domain-containing protein [Tanacetum cinerariifolium]